jgi:DNA ligase-1
MTTPKYTPVASLLHTFLDCLNDIASHSSTKAKQELLKFYLGYTEFKHLVVAILDPYKTYGINDFIQTKDVRAEQFGFYDLMKVLEDLQHRRLTGNTARFEAGVAVGNGVPGDLMIRILTNDPKAGFGATLVNKVCPGLIPEFPYMRCSLPEKSNMNKWDWSKGIYSQLKADGMFMNVNVDKAGQVELMSRQGQIFPVQGFEEFHAVARSVLLTDTQTHGEMVLIRDGKVLERQVGNGIINSVAQGGGWEGCEIRFQAWDQIPLEAVKSKGKYKVPYKNRFNSLLAQLYCENGPIEEMVSTVPWRLVYSKKEAYEHFAEIVAMGLEGTVDKDPEAIWADGTSKDQVKLKLEFCVDVEITGFTEGKGKFASTFGAITYRSKCGQLKGKVSGMTDDLRQYVSDNRVKYLGTIMAVEANAIFSPSESNEFYSLSHPRVKEFRNAADKSVADTLEQCFEQMRAAIANAAEIGG